MELFFLLVLIAIAAFLVIIISKTIKAGIPNTPTWKGIIISAIIGLLPLYLVLCFFGVMGKDETRTE